MFYDIIEDVRSSIIPTSAMVNGSELTRLPMRTIRTTNCYAYSLGITYSGGEQTNWYNPGFTIERNFCKVRDANSIISGVCQDLEILDIEFRKYAISDNVELEEGEYLIKAFLSYDDYHFIRYDPKTGIWFHKMGWYLEPKLINPSKKEMKKNSQFGIEPEKIGKYIPIGYFVIKEP